MSGASGLGLLVLSGGVRRSGQWIVNSMQESPHSPQ
jgi:hypothetical protein